MDLFRSAREAAVVASDPVAQRERTMVVAHQMAVSRREAAQRKHAFRVSGLKTQAVVAGGAAGVLGVATLGSGFNPIGDIILAGLAAASGVVSFRSSRKARELAAHPPEVAVPPLPPARLRPGARGAAQAERVRLALLHMYDLIPNVYALHPQAGHDLGRAVSEVEPLLRGQVERLAALDRIECEMPGSTPAWAAAKGAADIANRLDAGAVALEDLITAAATMLAAPDLIDGVTEVLLPAIDSLAAYAYGLHQASRSQQA
jgi:hypothetical protein